MGHLYLVRHARLKNVAGIAYGTEADIDDATPQSDFNALGAALPQNATWLTSGLPRTSQTAIRTGFAMREDPIFFVRPFLKEQDFGVWADQPHAWLREHDELYKRIRAKEPGWADLAPRRGESFNYKALQMAEGMGSLRDQLKIKDIIAFTHAGCVRGAFMAAQGITADEAVKIAVPHLSVTQFEPLEDDKWRVVSGPRSFTY